MKSSNLYVFVFMSDDIFRAPGPICLLVWFINPNFIALTLFGLFPGKAGISKYVISLKITMDIFFS